MLSTVAACVQGINRLGKGPAKPGTMRPQDPNKYKTMDIFSEGTEGDKDYQRMVQDVSPKSVPRRCNRPRLFHCHGLLCKV